MALVPYPDKEKLEPEVRRIVDEVPFNLVWMMAGMGRLCQPVMTVASVFINQGVLSSRLRELVTLRIAERLNAAYVRAQHLDIAAKCGVTKGELIAVSGAMPSSAFSESENAALLLVDSLVDGIKSPPETIKSVCDLLGESALHELFVISGFYHLTARYTESLEIEIDAGMGKDALGQLSALKLDA